MAAGKIKFAIRNRFTGDIQFTAEIKCKEGEPESVKIGLAVKWAIESGADLRRVDLSGAYLSGADLRRVDLSRAYLSGADLRRVDLSGADLSGAELSGAYLSGADLRGAYLSGADLRGADLSGVDLSGADLRRAYLSGADLRRAYLSGAKNAELAIAITRIIPAEGEIIGWKKCKNNILAKIKVPADAKRSHAFGRKCRAEFVDVLEVVGGETGTSKHDNKTTYTAGARVTCDNWCDDWTQECAGGIHFFITREEAAAY